MGDGSSGSEIANVGAHDPCIQKSHALSAVSGMETIVPADEIL